MDERKNDLKQNMRIKEDMPIAERKSKSVKNRIIDTIVTVLLVFAVLFCLFAAIQTLQKGYVSVGDYSFFRVVTGSMEPSIHIGTLILSKREPINNLRLNDVICFRSKSSDMLGQIITHRVVGINTNDEGQLRLLTKGDANTAEDAYFVMQDNLVGKVIWTSGDRNWLSELIGFLTGKFGFMACIAFPCLLIAGLMLRDSIGKIQRDMKKIVDEMASDGSVDDQQISNSEDGHLQSMSEQNDANVAINEANELDEEYQKMCERIRKELIEELKQRDQQKQNKE